MLSVLFATISSFIGEISSSVIKFEIDHKKETIYTAGFINTIFGALAFSALAIFRGRFIFSLASLPTFILRAFLEILQAQMTMLALVKSDRSTYAFVRNLTIPLLLIVDLAVGFFVTANQWAGILLIFVVLAVILAFHVINLRGIGYPLFTAINAVATISLFKYNITYFNSVEADQILIYAVLIIYFFFAARFFGKENPLRALKNKLLLGQGVFNGIAGLFSSFAIAFGNPGIAMTAERSSAVLAGIVSGRNYFQEKKFGAKLIACAVLVIGLALLAF